MRRLLTLAAATVAALALTVGPALACGGLVGPNGAVNLVRTSTLAAYHNGVEHYITAFEFAGGEGNFGSIVPLPGAPTDVVRGGDWTLQRLALEVRPPLREATAAPESLRLSEDEATVLLEVRIDALDITVLEGGALAVGRWAENNGFRLPPDAPEVLEFYAARSPYFMAAKFDADEALARGQAVGDGTPVHLTIPTDNPWVPLRILALGKDRGETIEADVFLLTDERPALLPRPGEFATGTLRPGLVLERSHKASTSLLADLRSDQGMEWMPESMWLTYIRVDTTAGKLTYDLAIDATGGGEPSRVAAGLVSPQPEPSGMTPVVLGAAIAIALAAMVVGVAVARVR